MNIEKYVDQLAEDISSLLEKTPPYALQEEKEDIVEAMMEFEDHVLNDRGVKVAEYTAISQDHLPRLELLSEGQLTLIVSSILNLLDHYNFHPVFPDGLPDSERYKKLREEWQKFKAPLVRYNHYHEFCSYDEENCPFPGYCDCCRVVAE